MYELPKLTVEVSEVGVDDIYTNIYGDKFFIPASRDEKRRWFAELLEGSTQQHGEFANLHSLKYRVYQAWARLGWAEFTNAHFPGDMIGFRITEYGKEVLGAKYA